MQEYIDYYMKKNDEREDIDLKIEGIKVHVSNNVFSPDPNITSASLIVIKKLKTIDLRTKTILDLGCGTGILSKYCLEKNANYVYACDIDENAIINSKENLQDYENCVVIKSDLFEKIDYTFDLILFNLPICNEVWNIDVIQLFDKFFGELNCYLNDEGIAMNVFAPFGEINEYRRLLDKHNLEYEEEFYDYFGFKWSLFIIHKNIPK